MIRQWARPIEALVVTYKMHGTSGFHVALQVIDAHVLRCIFDVDQDPRQTTYCQILEGASLSVNAELHR